MKHNCSIAVLCYILLGVALSHADVPDMKIDSPIRPDSKVYPNVDIRQEKGSTLVYWDDAIILELRDNRRLRFRATPLNDLWVGTKRTPMDLCWAYADSGVNDYVAEQVVFKSVANEERFYIHVDAVKPSVDGRVSVRIDGFWNPEQHNFNFQLTNSIFCELEAWYLNSNRAKNLYVSNPSLKPTIQGLNYHLERISWPDILLSDQPDRKLRYDWLVYAGRDDSYFTLMPKLHIPIITRRADYPASSTPLLHAGCQYGFLDRNHGGWITKILQAPSAIQFAPCWMFFDTHFFLANAVPLRQSTQHLDLTYIIHFVPVQPDEANALLGKAQEVGWRDHPEYQLPLFNRHNDFLGLVTEEGNEQHYVWWASSFNCFRDDTTGYNDNYSVSILHTQEDEKAAWYARCWGHPYDEEDVQGEYIIRAKVKTRDCGGGVRIGVAQSAGDYWIHARNFDPDAADWTWSAELTGTNDWSDLEVRVNMIRGKKKSIVLEQVGSGQSWFDQVCIEKLK